MTSEERARLEREIRDRCDRADFDGAATEAIRGYGPELYGFLVGFHRAEQDAIEVFSLVTERLWRGLPRFDWGCSFRTWAYQVARNASITYQDGARRQARGHVPLSEASEVSKVAEQVRTATASYLRTDIRDRFAALRASLSVDERMLLSLRVDRDLGWDELVRVLHAGEEPLAEEAIRRESARMRKRFQSLKVKLGDLARREGLAGKAR